MIERRELTATGCRNERMNSSDEQSKRVLVNWTKTRRLAKQSRKSAHSRLEMRRAGPEEGNPISHDHMREQTGL